MFCIKKKLREAVATKLRSARPGLHLVPELPSLHAILSAKLIELGPFISVAMACRLWWYARCIERCAHHAARAGACRR